MSAADVIEIFGGLGICDYTGQPATNGFLVPVLGHKWYSTEAHILWEANGKFYPEDLVYEKRVLNRMLNQINEYKNHEPKGH